MCKKLSVTALAINPSATLKTDTLYKKMKAEGIDVIGFAAGEPDFATPCDIKNAGISAIENDFTKYTPAAGAADLREAVCEKLKRTFNVEYEPSQIVVSSGAKHNLFITLQCLLNPGDEVLLPMPYWVSYPEMIKMCRAVPVVIDTDMSCGFKISAENIADKITAKTKAIILNSPSNPSGAVYSETELRKIAEVCIKNDIYIIADEIYGELVYDNEKFTSIASLGEDVKEHTILIGGVSKTYAMTGWRIGYSASNSQISRVMTNYQSNSTGSACSISQAAAASALNGSQRCVEEMRSEFEKRRNLMCEKLSKIPNISYVKPKGAFYVMFDVKKLCDRGWFKDADDFAGRLLSEGHVAVVSCRSFGLPYCVRLSFATSQENINKGLNRITDFISKICG